MYRIEIDWEFIGRQGAGNNKVRTTDTASFLSWLIVLRKTIGTKIIGASVPASGIVGPDGIALSNTAKYSTYIDYLTLMTYDFHASAWSTTTGPNAPLFTCNAASSSVDSSVNYWIKSGFAPCRILLGVPGYSHLWRTKTTKLATTKYNGVSTNSFQTLLATQPSDPTFTFKQLIALKYLDSTGKRGASGFTRYWDNCTKTPFVFNNQSKIWISYDDESSIGLKSLYAQQKGLAGISFYDLTGPTTNLLSAARRGLSGTFPSNAS